MNVNHRFICAVSRTLLAVPILLSLGAGTTWAADHYVRAGATGNGSGSDWTNACTDFTGSCAVSSLVRGDRYLVARGNYGSRVFNRAVSGNLVITIQGATAADHGTAPGWNPSFGVDTGPAVFAFDVSIETSHWVFDGSVGSGNTLSNYGFNIAKPSSCFTNQNYLFVGNVNQSATTTNITVKHVGVESCGPAFDVQQYIFTIGCAQCYVTNSTFANNFCDGGGKCWSVTNLANSVIEHTWVQNQWSSPSNHGEVLSSSNCHSSDSSGNSTACTQGFCNFNNEFRYNIIKGCEGTGCVIGLPIGTVCNSSVMRAWKVHGNVFVDAAGGNGVVSQGGVNGGLQNVEIYNNTFISCNGPVSWQCQGPPGCSVATGNIFRNNFLYNSTSALIESSGSPYVHTHNTYWNSIDGGNSESNGQTVTGTCPLVNCSIGNSGNYFPLQEGGTGSGRINNGTTLPIPFNTDPKGKTRGADGSWERGAFEFQRPAPPQNLRIQ